MAAGTLALGLVLAPLAFGAVQPWAWTGLLAVLVAGYAAGVLVDARRGALLLPRAPIMAGLCLAVGTVALQLVPLPAALVRATSTLTFERIAEADAAFASGAGRRPLSLDAGATVESIAKGAIFGLAFVLAARAARDPARARALLMLLVGLAVAETLYGLVELRAGEGRVLGVLKPDYRDVATGTYVNRNHFAALLAMAAPAAVGLAVEALRRDARGGAPEEAGGRSVGVAVALLGAAAVVLVGIMASRSRAGAATCGLGLVAAGLAAAESVRASRLGRAVAGAGALALLWAAATTGGALFERIDAAGREGGDASAYARWRFHEDALTIVRGAPLLGVGAGAFSAVYPHVQTIDLGGRPLLHAHDDALELACELGVPAAMALVAATLGTAVIALRAARGGMRAERRMLAITALAAWLPMAAHALLDFNLRVPANAAWWAALLGTAWGVAHPDAWIALPRPRGLAGRAAALGLVLGGAAALLTPAILRASADWVARPEVERWRGDGRPLDQRLGGLARAAQVWPYDAATLAALADATWEMAQRRHVTSAVGAAAGLLDTDRATRARVVGTGEAIAAASRRQSAELRAASATALALMDQALRIAPADVRWLERRARIRREAAEGP